MTKQQWPTPNEMGVSPPDPWRQETNHYAEQLRRERQAALKLALYLRGDKIARIKDAFIRLLEECDAKRCGVPPALRMLGAELLRDPRIERLPGTADHGLTDNELIAAEIEARHEPDPNGRTPSALNPSELSRLINEARKAGLDAWPEGAWQQKDYRHQIRRWRAKPNYRQAVNGIRKARDEGT